MIISGYTLDLYCDGAPDCQLGAGRPSYKKYTQYADEERSVCFKQAKADGWILNNTTRTAICPKCSKKNIKPNPII